MSSAVADLQVESLVVRKAAAGRSRLHDFENFAISLVLAGIIILPLAEAALRRTFHVGIPGSNAILQHLVLILGMLGSGSLRVKNGCWPFPIYRKQFCMAGSKPGHKSSAAA
jgi:hypothetical protein